MPLCEKLPWPCVHTGCTVTQGSCSMEKATQREVTLALRTHRVHSDSRISFKSVSFFYSSQQAWSWFLGATQRVPGMSRPRGKLALQSSFIAQMIDMDEWNKNLKIFLMCPKNFFRNRKKAIFTTRVSEKPVKSNISKSTKPISTNKVSNESI